MLAQQDTIVILPIILVYITVSWVVCLAVVIPVVLHVISRSKRD